MYRTLSLCFSNLERILLGTKILHDPIVFPQKFNLLCIMYFAQYTLRLFINQPGNPQLLSNLLKEFIIL